MTLSCVPRVSRALQEVCDQRFFQLGFVLPYGPSSSRECIQTQLRGCYLFDLHRSQ